MNHSLKKYWKNKKVFITGGTSGLGKALAVHLDELDAQVAVLARTEKNLKALIQKHPNIVSIQGDVSLKESVYPIAAEVHSRLGDVEVLFHVASYLGVTPLRLLVDTECEDLEQVLQTNVIGPFRLTKALLPGMLLKQQGVVVNISSDAAVNAYSRWGSYGISKAAIDHQSRIFDEELKSQGIRFQSIDPGDMNTPMHFAAIPDAHPEDLRDPAESAAEILQLIARQDFEPVRRKV